MPGIARAGPDARSFIQVFHMSARMQVLRASIGYLQVHQQEAESKVEQPQFTSVALGGVPSGHLIQCLTIPTPQFVLLEATKFFSQ